MKSKTYTTCSLMLVCLLPKAGYSAVNLLFEDFADATVTYTLDDPEGASGFDYWERNESGAGYNDEPSPGIFRGMDLAASPVPGITDGEGTLRFEGINISGYDNLEFSGWFALESPKASLIDGDGLRVTYAVDGGAEQNLFWLTTNATNDAYAWDTDFDGVGDSIALTRSFAQVANGLSIPVTGNSLELIFRLRVPGEGRGMAFDDILVTGQAIPEPSSFALIGGMLAMGIASMRRCRRI